MVWSEYKTIVFLQYYNLREEKYNKSAFDIKKRFLLKQKPLVKSYEYIISQP